VNSTFAAPSGGCQSSVQGNRFMAAGLVRHGIAFGYRSSQIYLDLGLSMMR
jgi:hypothetical protein